MDDLVDFIKARLDAEAADLDGYDGSYNDADGCWGQHVDPVGALADIDAKRRMLADADDFCAEYDAEIDDDNSAAQRAYCWRETIHRNLAVAYAEHPEYREEWWPTS